MSDGSRDSVLAAADRWAESVTRDDAFVAWHMRSGHQAAMAGELFVRLIEPLDDTEDEAQRSLALRATDDLADDDTPFLSLDYEAAVESFRARRIMTPEAFDELADRFRSGGFTARRLTSESLRTMAHRRILSAFENDDDGETLLDLVDSIRTGAFGSGYDPAQHDAVDTIVHTNVMTSYGFGKWQAMHDPDVVDGRPYWQLLTAGDGRVREAHRLLNERVFKIGTEESALYFPPIGYRCRCSSRTLSERQLKRWGLTVTDGVIPNVSPDPGWELPPAPLAPAT